MNFLVAVIFGLAVRFLPLSSTLLDLFSIIVLYNFAWGIFNLLPFPPLDGSHILFSFLPEKLSHAKLFLTQYGFFFLIFFVFWGIKYVFLAAAILYYLVTNQPFLI
jgi:Zn-dependent protease